MVRPFIFSIQMNSISKGNSLNFPRLLVERTILNWWITPESTILEMFNQAEIWSTLLGGS